jgi:hypothetical protein
LSESVHYSQLEQGARILASLAATEAERRVHLGWANRYYRLAADDASGTEVSAALLPYA